MLCPLWWAQSPSHPKTKFEVSQPRNSRNDNWKVGIDGVGWELSHAILLPNLVIFSGVRGCGVQDWRSFKKFVVKSP